MVIRRGSQAEKEPVQEEPKEEFLFSRGKEMLQSFGHAFVQSVKQIAKAVGTLAAKVRKDEDVLWDDGANNNIADADETKGVLINVVFIVYGLIAGFFAQNYSAFLSRRFAAWACGVNITSENILTSPLTIIMDAIIFFMVYLGALVLEGLVYWIFKLLYEKELYNGKEQMQVAYVYGILTMVLMSIVCILIPGNFFMAFY